MGPLSKNQDVRPQRKDWAPGNYECWCIECKSLFTSDKRACLCGDCAYKGVNEHLENIRRTAERGLKRALKNNDSSNADIFQHILDEYERVLGDKGESE